MLRIIACITQEHNLWLLLLAAAICVVTSVCVFLLLERARARDHGRYWAAAAGLAAGVGVWSTHFVAMTAYDVGALLSFAPLPVLASLAISLAMQIAAFLKVFYARDLRGRVLAGAAAGVGVGLMHYAGMFGLEASALMAWDLVLVGVSVLAGVLLSGLAMLVFFNAPRRLRAVQAGVVFVLAICGLHFTGMSALTLTPIGIPAAVHGMSQSMLGVVVGFGALLCLIAGLCVALADAYLSDRRQQEARLQEMVAQRTAELHELAKKQGELAARAAAASEAKSQFLANMSHELRTPLNAIIGYGEIVYEDCAETNPQSAEDMTRILASAKHLLAIINDVLDVSRIEARGVNLEAKPFNVADMVSEAVDSVRPRAAQDCTALRVFLAPDLGMGVGDAFRLKQCLVNLLSNAVKFGGGGEVTVRASQELVDGEAWLVFDVTDTGIGMTKEQIALLFEPFVQADASVTRRFGGTGLGLSITRRLINLMGGAVTVSSVWGRGSTFTIKAPAYLAKAGQKHLAYV